MTEAEARRVVGFIEEHFKKQGYEVDEFAWFLAGHDHEGLPEGSWSLACESGLPYEWTIEVSQAAGVLAAIEKAGLDVLLEPRNNCILGLIDQS